MAWVEELHSRFDGCHMVRLKGNEPVELPVARERVRALKRAASF
jgi:DNA-binding LytR/AlgR family response regulator